MKLRALTKVSLCGEVRRMGVVAIVCGVSGLALAVPQSAESRDEPLLKGPEVKERAVPGVVNTFGESQERRRMAERIPPEVLREALGVLVGEDVPEAIRATPEQEQQFRSVAERLRAATREYMAKHREELIELRKDANLSGRGAQEIDRAIGRRPGEARRERARGADETDAAAAAPMMGEVSEAKQEAARQRLREIMAGAPKIEDAMTRVWEGLSEAQREAVDAKLNEYREREAKRREEMYVRQRVDSRQPEGASARPGAGRPSGDDMMMQQGEGAAPGERARPARPEQPVRPNAANAQRRERLMRLFDRLSPEQQEMLLERLEGAARDGALGPARQRGQRQAPSTDKPAPGMDEVDVPRPEEVERDAPPARQRKRPDPA
jgi:hypothetical protein